MTWRRFIKTAFGLAGVFFLGYYLNKNWDSLGDYDWKFNFWLFAASMALLWLAIAGSVFTYARLLNMISEKPLSYFKVYRLFNLTNIGRYIPGRLWSIIGFVYYSGEYGISPKRAAVATIINEVASKTAALTVGLLYFVFSDEYSNYLPIMLAVLALDFIIIHPKILNRVANAILRLLKKKPIEIDFSYFAALKICSMYVIVWIFHSVAFYVLIAAITELGPIHPLQFAAILPLCWIIGYLVIFAPGGIGVREAMLVVMLGKFMPQEVALIIAIVQRIWFTLVEAINFVSALVIPLGKAAISNETSVGSDKLDL